MKTPPTETDVALRKKLRLLGEFFASLSATHPKKWYGMDRDPNHLPPRTVAAVQTYAREHGIENADLMAVRDRPGHWCRMSQPYRWLWLLHRYTNRYSK